MRGTIFLTIFYVRHVVSTGGCQFPYLTHSDPKGWHNKMDLILLGIISTNWKFEGKIPIWLLNRLTTIIAPKLLKKLYKCCLKYAAWKDRNEHGNVRPPWREIASAEVNLMDAVCKPELCAQIKLKVITKINLLTFKKSQKTDSVSKCSTPPKSMHSPTKHTEKLDRVSCGDVERKSDESNIFLN